MKCYVCFLGTCPADEGALLVYAETRNRARWMAQSTETFDSLYLEWKARRVPELDQYAGQVPAIVWTNDDLPDGVTYYDDEVC